MEGLSITLEQDLETLTDVRSEMRHTERQKKNPNIIFEQEVLGKTNLPTFPT
jgi:hypothetical protein